MRERMHSPEDDMIEVLITLTLSQYEQMGADLDALRRQLDLPRCASNTQAILEVVTEKERDPAEDISDVREAMEAVARLRGNPLLPPHTQEAVDAFHACHRCYLPLPGLRA